MGFKFKVSPDVTVPVTIDDLLAEEGLKEIGIDLLEMLKTWLRKVYIWLETKLSNKKMEDIKNTPENVIKEAVASVEAPFEGELEEGYIWQPSINYATVEILCNKITKVALKQTIEDDIETFMSSHSICKMGTTPCGCLISDSGNSYKYVSGCVARIAKALDKLVVSLKYVNLGEFPSCRKGIICIRQALEIGLKTLKYYDEIIDSANSDVILLKNVLGAEDTQDLTLKHGVRICLTSEILTDSIFAGICNGEVSKFKPILEKIAGLSNGKYKLIDPRKGERFDFRYMRSKNSEIEAVDSVRCHGLIRVTDNVVLFKAIVD